MRWALGKKGKQFYFPSNTTDFVQNKFHSMDVDVEERRLNFCRV